MDKVLLVAERELYAFYTTWTGYIVAAVSLFVSGLLFHANALGDQPEYSEVIISNFFYLLSGVGMVAAVCLAMRLLAEEKQTGTIFLFYTSPISERQIIYGKFFSAMVFFLFLQIMTLYMPALIFVHGKVSLGHLASGYLGVILLGSATMALALFASVLAPNQLIAAVLGALFVVTLLILWMLSSITESPMREIFGYLALHNDHFNPFRKGLVHSQHIIFYLSVTFFGLECATRALEVRRWKG